MTESIATPTQHDLQQHAEDNVKVKVFRDGNRIEIPLHELPQTVQKTAYAVLVSSNEF